MNRFTFALRNVFRNKRRTFLTGLSIFLAAVVVALTVGTMKGFMNNYWDSYIRYQTGNVRVVSSEFVRRERFVPVDETIPLSDELIANIRKIKGVLSVEERIRFGILLSRGDQSVPAFGVGIDLLSNNLRIGKKLVRGELKESGIYIGDQLASKLRVNLGEELLLVTKTSEGGLNGIKLPIAGIFRFGVTQMDKQFFYIDRASAKKLLRLHDATTEIYVFTDKRRDSAPVQEKIKPLLPEGVVAQHYRDNMGQLYKLVMSFEYMMYFFEALLLFLASFVVINTMMMAVYERMGEIGTLKSLGMTDRALFVNFTIEGAIIGAMGGISGAVVGYVLVWIFSLNGLDMGPFMDNVDMPIESMLYPSANITVLIVTIVLSIVMPALASMIPSWQAKKMTPAEALNQM